MNNRMCDEKQEEELLSIEDICIHDVTLSVDQKLEQDRKIYLDSDEIDKVVLNIQRQIVAWNIEDKGIPKEERKPIYIYITTGGGDVTLMWTLVDTIELSITPVYTVNIGFAASAGGVILIAGHKRFMFEHARVLIHEGSASIEGDIDKIRDWYSSCEQTIKESQRYILQHTNIPPRVMKKRKTNDWVLDAETCLQYGICDEIVRSIDQII